MGSVSIWSQDGRKERFGIMMTDSKLAILREKRKRQISKLLRKYESRPAIYWRIKNREPK